MHGERSQRDEVMASGSGLDPTGTPRPEGTFLPCMTCQGLVKFGLLNFLKIWPDQNQALNRLLSAVLAITAGVQAREQLLWSSLLPPRK